jgi:hypothetical protein
MVFTVLGLYTLSCVGAGARRDGIALSWVQLSRFHLKTETQSSLRNVVLNKNRTMNKGQKHELYY